MAIDLEGLRSEMETFLIETGTPIFRGFYDVMTSLTQVVWDADRYSDFREFVSVGRKAGAKLFIFSSQSFSLDQIDEALDMLEASSLSHEEKRSFEGRLKQLQAYEGFTCSLELSFVLEGQIYQYQRQTEWFRTLSEIVAELDDVVSEEDEAEDSDGLSGYFSKN